MYKLFLLSIVGTACLFFQLPTWASPESTRSEQVRPLKESFRLRAVRLEGSTVFDRERVDEIVAPYLGKEDVQLSVRLATQLTPNVLPSVEECAIGGINGNRFIFGNTVRGYATNVRSGDNCLALSTELQFELLETSNWGTVALISFLDFGTVWDNKGEVFAPNTLVSTGLGLRWLIGDYLSLRADYGIGLVEVEQESLEKQHWNVSLELGTSF